MIVNLLTTEAQNWRDTFGKPVIQFEYGGDTMEGMHSVRDPDCILWLFIMVLPP